MNTKKYLASANSSVGFINKFNYINPEKNGFTYILKGGPGTGKSTFMKDIGKYFEDKNYFVEYFYCSSDSESLDGVRVKNISVVDGTAPHVTEATMPQVKEKIINVGEFIGTDIIKDKRDIGKFLNNKSRYFKKGYLYFESLGKIFEEEKLSTKHNRNVEKYESIIQKINLKSGHCTKRELFESFITKDGYKSFYNTNDYNEKIVLDGNFVENKKVMTALVLYLEEHGVNFIKFNSIFMPDFIEGIYINKLDTLIVCENAYLENFVNFKNRFLIEKIIKKIAYNLDMAKKNHKKVEGYYIKNMNFEALNRLEKNVIREIEDRIR